MQIRGSVIIYIYFLGNKKSLIVREILFSSEFISN